MPICTAIIQRVQLIISRKHAHARDKPALDELKLRDLCESFKNRIINVECEVFIRLIDLY